MTIKCDVVASLDVLQFMPQSSMSSPDNFVFGGFCFYELMSVFGITKYMFFCFCFCLVGFILIAFYLFSVLHVRQCQNVKILITSSSMVGTHLVTHQHTFYFLINALVCSNRVHCIAFLLEHTQFMNFIHFCLRYNPPVYRPKFLNTQPFRHYVYC